jgi:hypothetical protein
MRLQLAVGAAVAVLAPAPASGDGTLALRGVYYKERSTRVIQPMLDAAFEAGARGLVTAHLLVDAITSASQSAGAVNAEPFTERRYEVGGGYSHELSGAVLSATARYSTEPDYRSTYVGVRGELAPAQKNAQLAIGAGLGRDTLSGGPASGLAQLMLQCEPGAAETPECGLHTYAVFVSASHLLSRTATAGVSFDYIGQRGYLANPYRSAIVGTPTSVGTQRERHPSARDRRAAAVFGRYYVRPTATTLVGSYRFYSDDWGIHAHTPELRAVQELGPSADLSLRYRFHAQTRAATFYAERYETEQMLVSDDVKLSRFTGHTMEGKLGVLGEVFGLSGIGAGARAEIIFSYVVQNNRFGNAVVAHAALSIPFSY